MALRLKMSEDMCMGCHKHLVYSRSLTEREQLGEMVAGVTELIAAFQADTGAICKYTCRDEGKLVAVASSTAKQCSVLTL